MYSSGMKCFICALAAKSIGLKRGTGSSFSACWKVNDPMAWHADACGVMICAVFDLNELLICKTADNSIGFNVNTTDWGISSSSKSSIGLNITY